MTVARYLSQFVNFLSSAGVANISGGGTNITTYTTGDILYASGTNTLSQLPIGSSNQVLTVSGGLPAWTTTPSNNASYVYTSAGSGTWTPPSVGTFVLVRLWAGGGSGAKGPRTQSIGGGGGGIYAQRFYSLSTFGGSGQSYTVAAGGASVTGTSSNGNVGGNSTFSSGANLLTAYGGGAGTTSNSGDTGTLFAAGTSTQSNIDAQQPWYAGAGGRPGFKGYMGGGGGGGATINAGFAGGSSVGAGAGGAAGYNANGTDGTAPSGGGGCSNSSTSSAHTSGKGGDGRIEIWVW